LRIKGYTVLMLMSIPHLFGASLTFDGAVEQFLAHNEDLQIARQETKKTDADLITARERPNPVLSGSYEFMDVNHGFKDTSRGSNAQATVILSHPIETADKREKRIRLAEKAIGYSRVLYDETVRKQLGNLVDAYYTVVSDQADWSNARDNADAYSEIMAVAKTKFDHGFLSRIDYEKLSLQQIDYAREVEKSRLALFSDTQQLASLLALPSAELNVTAPRDIEVQLPPLEPLLAQITQRADCKAAKENQSVAEAALNLEKANAVPNVGVGIEYASFGPTYEPLFGMNVSLPLPVYDRNEGEIEKSRIATFQAATYYEKVLRTAKIDLLQNYEMLRSALSLYQSVRTGFSQAKELKEKQEKVFALKGISVLDLLDSQKHFREYQKNLTKSMIDLYIASARLKLSSGMPQIGTKGL